MPGWSSGTPAGIKFTELDVICSVLECTVVDLMVTEPVAKPAPDTHREQDEPVRPRAVTPPVLFRPRREPLRAETCRALIRDRVSSVAWR
jgi:Cro/C1-type HTH DNA-binding domain